jgi:ribosomal protein S12 methylthiotransferase accessory factor YcaO
MQSLGSLLRSPFSFLFTRSSTEDRVAAYVVREHARGRGLSEILEDRYVQNRLTLEQQSRLLDRPEVVHALGDDAVEQTRRELESLAGT